MTPRLLKFLQACLAPWEGRSTSKSRVALLIDGDGISAKDADRAIAAAESMGRHCILRVYRNLAEGNNAAWAKLVKRHGVLARHMPSMAPGKNGTDIALSIDAVEILLTRHIDTFVIVTNDSDFAPLARRIREEGKDVIGIGRSATQSFRDACTEFHEIQKLTPPPIASLPMKLWSLQPADAETMVVAALTGLERTDRLTSVDELGRELALQFPGFDTRQYRRRKLADLLRDLPSVELIDRDGNSYARLREGGS